MSQDFNTETYEPSATFSVNLVDIENNFAALKSSFSGTAAPSSPVAGQVFFHNTKKNLQIRNQANSAWLGAFYGSTSFKIWKYVNAAEDGWVQDSTITDKVIAIKGGSTYMTGGTTVGGSWIIAGNAIASTGSSHNHQIYDYPGFVSGGSWESNGSTPKLWVYQVNVGNRKTVCHSGSGSLYTITEDLYSENTTHTHTISHTGTWRPAAQVGIMVYPNV